MHPIPFQTRNQGPVPRSPLRGVNKRHPCPICQHDHWCSVAADGSLCICMRVEAGSVKKARNEGFVHILKDQPAGPRLLTILEPKPARHDWALLARRFQTALNPDRLHRLARDLGLSIESLQRLGIGWAWKSDLSETDTCCRGEGCWTFPMSHPTGPVLGIRLRTSAGFKYAVEGSRDGLFIPCDLPDGDTLLITEGPTDCAALLDLGFAVVGRSCCTSGGRLLIDLVRQRRYSSVVIVADGDKPGQDGASTLASLLVLYVRQLRIITPPQGIKDARAWKSAGATTADLHAAVVTAPLWKLNFTGKRAA
ncbi:MAG: toprim domain-containing protein [Bacillota bacterium]